MRGILLGSLAALTVQHINAHPLVPTAHGLGKRAVDLNAFRLKVASDYVNSTAVVTDPSFAPSDPKDTATGLVKTTVPKATFRLVESYTGNNGVAHFYFRQTANDLDIDNADFNVNVSQTSR
jgi:extracellular elastinolytic metalloproteinase